MQTLYNTGRLGGTGYLSILPVDRGVEHWRERRLLLTRSTLDPKTLSSWRLKQGVTVWHRRMACWPPFLAAMLTAFRSSSKLNHNETLSYPTEYDQTLYASVSGVQHGRGWRSEGNHLFRL